MLRKKCQIRNSINAPIVTNQSELLRKVHLRRRRSSSLQAVLCQFQGVRFVRRFQVAQEPFATRLLRHIRAGTVVLMIDLGAGALESQNRKHGPGFGFDRMMRRMTVLSLTAWPMCLGFFVLLIVGSAVVFQLPGSRSRRAADLLLTSKE